MEAGSSVALALWAQPDYTLLFAGLERVAEELMGRRKWKQYQDTVLKSSLRIEPEIQDWEPLEKCCMCDGRPFPESATVSVFPNT